MSRFARKPDQQVRTQTSNETVVQSGRPDVEKAVEQPGVSDSEKRIMD